MNNRVGLGMVIREPQMLRSRFRQARRSQAVGQPLRV